jgi:hypothetical protein
MKIANTSKKREKIVKWVYFLKIGTGTGCCPLRMHDDRTGLVERALEDRAGSRRRYLPLVRLQLCHWDALLTGKTHRKNPQEKSRGKSTGKSTDKKERDRDGAMNSYLIVQREVQSRYLLYQYRRYSWQ